MNRHERRAFSKGMLAAAVAFWMFEHPDEVKTIVGVMKEMAERTENEDET